MRREQSRLLLPSLEAIPRLRLHFFQNFLRNFNLHDLLEICDGFLPHFL